MKDAVARILEDPRIPPGTDRAPLSRADYLTYIDGMPLEEGAVRFLAARGVPLEKGRKQMTPEPGLDSAWAGGKTSCSWNTSGATASKATPEPCKCCTGSPHIRNLFTVVMDGTTAAGLRLQGKPAPDVFLAAQRGLASLLTCRGD